MKAKLAVINTMMEELRRWIAVLDGYLDVQNPDWRSSLPIYVPPDNEKIARRLLGGLLSEKAGSVVASGITVDLFLSFDGGRWLPVAILNAEGKISTAKLPGMSMIGRWKASPSGDLTNFLPNQIALFESPTDDQPTWRVRYQQEYLKDSIAQDDSSWGVDFI